MFTGIVDHVGVICGIERCGSAITLIIESKFAGLTLGESIAVDGICLTVTARDVGKFSVDLSPETVSVTTANQWVEGQQVHLEPALRVGDRLGGHWVSGHIDGTLQVKSVEMQGDCMLVQIGGMAPADKRYLIDKGSIAVDGVSLTVNKVSADYFTLMLIPHTLTVTKLSSLREGSMVNVEYDYLLKWAARDKNLQYGGVIE